METTRIIDYDKPDPGPCVQVFVHLGEGLVPVASGRWFSSTWDAQRWLRLQGLAPMRRKGRPAKKPRAVFAGYVFQQVG